MSPSARPRGPLPARVYWVRRAIVLGIPLVLVVVLARVLGGSADGKDPEQATRASAPTTPSAGSSAPSLAGPTAPAAATGRKGRKKAKPAPPPEPVLAEPTGPCTHDDIVITPTLTTAAGGADVPITLNVRTQETEACTWQASADTMAVTITSGSDHIWSLRECPTSIAASDVVVRRAVDALVTVTWNARRSEEGCSSPSAEWAMPGWYHIEAAALAGEPTDVQFELVAPSAPVVTKTVEPKPKKGKRGERREHRAGDDGGGNSDG
ncbi:hypothetical protein EXE58_05425 [Nocardioides seonyuensis]|uniref:DUF4232 domain-containing protein n=1 Tax=Nocardioides seonyuensis TaxID=2518371 RepID=A0A4P7ICV9_9ACTN|nr:hypothetical protein [Nocardioides seonyuensis]QBX54949.1 hypothetical protein EXE58_05425 [Nocardioides seonyuensis]